MFRPSDDDETESQHLERMTEADRGLSPLQSFERRQREQAEIARTMVDVAAYHAQFMQEYEELFV